MAIHDDRPQPSTRRRTSAEHPSTPVVARPAPRWQRRKQARPAEIIGAALDVFTEKGYVATKLEDVARRAGVTKGTMYLYFESKEALFKAVVRESLLVRLANAERAVEDFKGPTPELLRMLVTRWWEGLGESRLSGLPKLVIAEASNFPDMARFYYDEVIQRGHTLIGKIIERGVARGEFRRTPLLPTVRLVLAPVLFAALWKHSFVPYDPEPFDLRAYVQLHIDFFLRAVSNPPAEATPS